MSALTDVLELAHKLVQTLEEAVAAETGEGKPEETPADATPPAADPALADGEAAPAADGEAAAPAAGEAAPAA